MHIGSVGCPVFEDSWELALCGNFTSKVKSFAKDSEKCGNFLTGASKSLNTMGNSNKSKHFVTDANSGIEVVTHGNESRGFITGANLSLEVIMID